MLKRSITKKIVIETQIDKTLPPVNIDANQIHQAIIHICTNACDSMSDGGILTLKTFKGTNNNTFGDSETAIPMDNYCIVSVKDTGSGIPKSIVKKVFDPFFTTKPIGKGTGLGLSITHSLVKNHGGHISIESEEGKGTTVLIYLPLANDNLSISEVKEAEHPAGGNEKILLIDDEDSVLRITEKMLTKAGYDVISASSGIQGIDIFNLNKDDFDLVIIDLIMPEMDGHETYEKIREIKPGIKVVFLSGFSIDGKHHKLIDNITCAFIQKPFGYTKLLSKIRAILDTKENAT
ncbi:MAG TPA: ATP-binding protein [bacterium]|nr:ATP-binding protein [bacterium]